MNDSKSIGFVFLFRFFGVFLSVVLFSLLYLYLERNEFLFFNYFYNWLLKIVGLAISVVGGGKIGNYIGRIVTRNEKGGVVRTNKKL